MDRKLLFNDPPQYLGVGIFRTVTQKSFDYVIWRRENLLLNSERSGQGKEAFKWRFILFHYQIK